MSESKYEEFLGDVGSYSDYGEENSITLYAAPPNPEEDIEELHSKQTGHQAARYCANDNITENTQSTHPLISNEMNGSVKPDLFTKGQGQESSITMLDVSSDSEVDIERLEEQPDEPSSSKGRHQNNFKKIGKKQSTPSTSTRIYGSSRHALKDTYVQKIYPTIKPSAKLCRVGQVMTTKVIQQSKAHSRDHSAKLKALPKTTIQTLINPRTKSASKQGIVTKNNNKPKKISVKSISIQKPIGKKSVVIIKVPSGKCTLRLIKKEVNSPHMSDAECSLSQQVLAKKGVQAPEKVNNGWGSWRQKASSQKINQSPGTSSSTDYFRKEAHRTPPPYANNSSGQGALTQKADQPIQNLEAWYRLKQQLLAKTATQPSKTPSAKLSLNQQTRAIVSPKLPDRHCNFGQDLAKRDIRQQEISEAGTNQEAMDIVQLTEMPAAEYIATQNALATEQGNESISETSNENTNGSVKTVSEQEKKDLLLFLENLDYEMKAEADKDKTDWTSDYWDEFYFDEFAFQAQLPEPN